MTSEIGPLSQFNSHYLTLLTTLHPAELIEID